MYFYLNDFLFTHYVLHQFISYRENVCRNKALLLQFSNEMIEFTREVKTNYNSLFSK